jgi:hypothetical protein
MATTWEAKASSSSPADGLSTPDIFKTEFAHLVCEHLAVALQNCALGCVVNSKRDDAGTARWRTVCDQGTFTKHNPSAGRCDLRSGRKRACFAGVAVQDLGV